MNVVNEYIYYCVTCVANTNLYSYTAVYSTIPSSSMYSVIPILTYEKLNFYKVALH